VSPAQVRYHPDEWAHDLDEWWAPLTGLAAKADCASDDWLSVLGVGEFFEPRLLEQARVLTPWICLAASAVAASAARRWAEVAAQPDAEPAARALATAAFGVAVGLERLRWDGRRIGEGVLSTGDLLDLGRRAVQAPEPHAQDEVDRVEPEHEIGDRVDGDPRGVREHPARTSDRPACQARQHQRDDDDRVLETPRRVSRAP